MKLSVEADEFVHQAVTGGYIGIPYEKLDCQGFVERVLKDCGVRKENGSVYDWKGSNSMYRNFYSWRGTLEECKQKYGLLPPGCFLFHMEKDGGEVERGYHDGLGNFKHVGIYLGDPYQVIHSTTGGVQWGKLDSRWNYVTLPSMIDFFSEPVDNISREKILSIVMDMRKLCDELERLV